MRFWLAFLVLVTFGVGWTTKALTERWTGDEAPMEEEAQPETPRGRSRWGGDRRLLTIRSFAKELDLGADQVSELEQLIDEVSDRIRDHEKAIGAVLEDSRIRVDQLMTEDQKERLDALIERRNEERLRERHRAIFADATKEQPLDDAEREQALNLLWDYEQARRDLFRQMSRRGRDDDRRGDPGEISPEDGDRRGDDGREQRRALFQELREQYEGRLGELVGAPVAVEVFKNLDDRRWRR
ncbi:MAG: hypothetical protein RL885_26905 [Planctomycetota bacterium]